MVSTSSVPGATFNLTSKPTGPMLYHAGSGIFTWGTGITYEWAVPQMVTTRTITVGDVEVNVIAENSTSWLDRQYGPGFATGGWQWGSVLMDNGLIMSYCHTLPLPGKNKTLTFSTILYPDGHHETNEIQFDLHLSDPFVSTNTGLTYYSNYQVNIPRKGIVLDMQVPVQTGEMAWSGSNSTDSILFEGYTKFNGTIDGEVVSGYGITEQKYPTA